MVITVEEARAYSRDYESTDEEMAALPGFTQLHPLQPEETVQGALEALHLLGRELREILGMDEVTFQPAAGAHGELTGVMLIKAYHLDRGIRRGEKFLCRTPPMEPIRPRRRCAALRW